MDNWKRSGEKFYTGSRRLPEEEFYGVFRSALAGRLEDGCSLEAKEIRKNNGGKYRGLAVRKKGKNVAPVLCLEDLYQKYLAGDTVDALLGEVCKACRERFSGPDIDPKRVTDWKQAESCLFLKVVSTEMNGELLRTVPHRDVLDLSMIMYIRLDGPDIENPACVLVNDDQMIMWGQSWEKVYETAMQNTIREGISFTNISHTITSLLDGTEDDYLLDKYLATRESPMFVLTNKANVYGAVFMVLPQVMEQVADDMGGDVYVIPSSIHESLVAPVSKIDDLALLHQLVCDVNRMQVPLSDRLSDHVYRYSRGKGLSIAV